jgi:hypothetical protein
MKKYSEFFTSVYDESKPVGYLGRGSHYSILRAILWNPNPKFHDFAVIWDEDHDERVIWVIEQLYVNRLLEPVVAIGERKGGITVLTRSDVSDEYEEAVFRISESVPSDSFNSHVETFSEATNMIINDSIGRVRAYLSGIDALWRLGTQDPWFSTVPFGATSSGDPVSSMSLEEAMNSV